jgi:hypothetical protein
LLAALSPDEVEQLDGAIQRLLEVMSSDALADRAVALEGS